MLLQHNASRSWNSADVAAELRITKSTAEAVLDTLASNNFLDIKISNDILFRYNPASPELKQAAARCAHFYKRERMAVISLVTSGTTPLQDFTDEVGQ